MKKTLLFLVVIGLGPAVFSSCVKGADEPQSAKPLPIGTWQTDSHYYKETTEEIYVDISEDDAYNYHLLFNEDGTGYLSENSHDWANGNRIPFTWKMDNGQLDIKQTGFEFIMSGINVSVPEGGWVISKSPPGTMVLTQYFSVSLNSHTDGGRGQRHDNTVIYRYTFEKIVEE